MQFKTDPLIQIIVFLSESAKLKDLVVKCTEFNKEWWNQCILSNGHLRMLTELKLLTG